MFRRIPFTRPMSAPKIIPVAAASPAAPAPSLVERAQEGEPWAIEALFRAHIVELTETITQLVGQEADADDIVQEAFAEALRDLPKLRQPAAFRGWLHKIALNRARKLFRRRSVLRALGLGIGGAQEGPLSALASPELSPEGLAELRLLDQVLTRLPAQERMAWMLRHVRGEALETIAQWLGCSLATTKRRLQAAQLSVQAHVEGRAV